MTGNFARRVTWRIGRRIYCNARGEQRSGDIHRNGESLLQELVLKHAAEGECLRAVDIGANQGEWTASLLDATPHKRLTAERLRIDAFEPVPSTASMYRDTISRHVGGDCAKLHELAISSENGHSQIAIYAEGAGTNTLHFAQEGRSYVKRIDIKLQTLAKFCETNGLDHIHLAKCDTEGHDLNVLLGARPLLTAGRIDIIQFEYNHRWIFARAFLKDVFDLIEGLDYELVRIDARDFPVFEHWHPELERFFQSNYALVHDRALEWLPLRRGSFDASNTYS